MTSYELRLMHLREVRGFYERPSTLSAKIRRAMVTRPVTAVLAALPPWLRLPCRRDLARFGKWAALIYGAYNVLMIAALWPVLRLTYGELFSQAGATFRGYGQLFAQAAVFLHG